MRENARINGLDTLPATHTPLKNLPQESSEQHDVIEIKKDTLPRKGHELPPAVRASADETETGPTWIYEIIISSYRRNTCPTTWRLARPAR